jgi:hypothetical protein
MRGYLIFSIGEEFIPYPSNQTDVIFEERKFVTLVTGSRPRV